MRVSLKKLNKINQAVSVKIILYDPISDQVLENQGNEKS
tara:strand:+ start:461 stop:577 length:117 start_codon:yes stop_codon:yes gene_type:complete